MWKAHDIAKKQHRERAQPQNRRKWGLLEKKKDYRLRAQDYHRKEAHLALLRSKAEQANEDEFNFGMIKARTKDGVLVASRGAEVLSQDAVKLLKTQDSGYVRSLLDSERAKIDKAKHSIMVDGSGKHTIFVDDKQTLEDFNPAEYFDTDASLVKRRQNRLRSGQIDSLPDVSTQRKSNDELEKLKKRVDRRDELSKVQEELALQRELMKKGDKKKIVAKDGSVSYKWKKIRKR